MNKPSMIHAEQMSLALAEVIDKFKREQDDKRKNRELNKARRLPPDKGDDIVDTDDFIPKRTNYKTLNEYIYAMLEFNLKEADINHQELSESFDSLPVEWSRLLDQMAQIYRRHKPVETMRAAV